MAVIFGVIPSGTSASSAFALARADRALALGVSSHAALAWSISFQATPAAPFLKFATATFSGAAGGWGVQEFVPTATVRVETSGTVSATTSFALIELVR